MSSPADESAPERAGGVRWVLARWALRGLPRGRLARGVTLAIYWVGALLGVVFLVSPYTMLEPIALASLVTAARLARDGVHRPESRLARATGWAAALVIAGLYSLLLYLSIAWGSVLYWAVPWWGVGLAGALGVAVFATADDRWRGPRVPVVLPMGLWVTLCLIGWRNEEGFLRCDDYLAAVRDPAVRLVVPTSSAIRACRPGQELLIDRYPRVIWPAPEGLRIVFTTQSSTPALPVPDRAQRLAPTTLDGSICEAWLDDPQPPRCIGEGKAQGIGEDPLRDRLFVASWGNLGPGVHSRLYSLPRSRPIEALDVSESLLRLAELFYDPEVDMIYGFPDEGQEVLILRGQGLERQPSVAVPFEAPGQVRYDGERHEGVLCAAGGPFFTLEGERFMSVAVEGAPLRMRPLGQHTLLTYAAVTWGCDWDPSERRVYVNVPNLGLLATLDYDSGRLLDVMFVGFALRAAAFDRARRRVYLTDFLGGSVVAVDLDRRRVMRRWAVGRFPRLPTLSRDGRLLLVGTNLGVMSIALDEASSAPGAAGALGVDEVLARAAAAHGGRDRVGRLGPVRIEGSGRFRARLSMSATIHYRGPESWSVDARSAQGPLQIGMDGPECWATHEGVPGSCTSDEREDNVRFGAVLGARLGRWLEAGPFVLEPGVTHGGRPAPALRAEGFVYVLHPDTYALVEVREGASRHVLSGFRAIDGVEVATARVLTIAGELDVEDHWATIEVLPDDAAVPVPVQPPGAPPPVPVQPPGAPPPVAVQPPGAPPPVPDGPDTR